MDSEAPIRLGIVGCGAVAQICHLKALVTLPQFEVSVLCDRNTATAEAARVMYGLRAKVTDRISDLAGSVDAAIVCVWAGQHLPVTRELLAMGLDVLCEKPVAASSTDAIAMAQLAEQTGRIVAIGQWCRCQKNMWILRRLLGQNYLGDITAVSAEFGNELSWPMTSGAYYDRNITAGGVMFDAGIHVIDLVVWLFGDIDEIQYQDDSLGGVESNGLIEGAVTIAGNSVVCRIGASWTHDLSNGIRITGTMGDAEARFTLRDELIVRQRVGIEQMETRIPQGDLLLPFSSSNPYAAQLEDFAHALQTRQLPITPVASTVLPLAILERAYSRRRPMDQPWVDAHMGSRCLTTKS